MKIFAISSKLFDLLYGNLIGSNFNLRYFISSLINLTVSTAFSFFAAFRIRSSL